MQRHLCPSYTIPLDIQDKVSLETGQNWTRISPLENEILIFDRPSLCTGLCYFFFAF